MADQTGGKRLAGGAPKKDGPRRPKKEKKPGRLTVRQKLLIAAAAVLAVALIGVLAWKSVFVRPDLEVQKEPPAPDPETGEPAVEEEEIDWGEGLRPRSEGERKSADYYTVLILGRDTGGGGNTDTILLAAYDIPNQELNVMSIPRDTMVNVNWDVKKINSVYNFNGGGDEGIQALYKEVSELVGFVPDFSIVVEWEAVGELVNAIGGVWYDVPRDMDYDDPAQDLSIHVKAGYQKLDGEQAMGVVRFREGKNGYATGDLGRIETQQTFLKALIEQCLQIDKMTKVFEYARIFTEQVTTDLTVNNMAWFAQKAIFGGLTSDNIHFITMPCTTKSVWSRSYHANLSYVVPNVDELIDVVNESFNPYLDDLSSSELDIMYVNSDGTIGCTSGRLQDSKANSSLASRPSSGGGTETVDPDVTDPVEPDVPVEPEDPGTTDPGTTDPGTTDPGTTDPGTTDPGTTDPGTTDPGTTDPGTTDPGTTDPGTTDPGTTDPGTTDPGGTDPTVPDPGVPDAGTTTDSGAGLPANNTAQALAPQSGAADPASAAA